MDNHVYARTEGTEIIEWPVKHLHIINRGLPLSWFTQVQQTMPPAHNTVTHYLRQAKPEWSGDDLIQRWETVQKSPNQLSAELLQRVVTDVDNALIALKIGYPEQETETWQLQKTEAEAWTADNTADTPILSYIATRRGLDMSVLVDRVLTKSAQYANLVGLILGDRQAAEDTIETLQEAKPTDWFEQLVTLHNTWNTGWPPELLQRPD